MKISKLVFLVVLSFVGLASALPVSLAKVAELASHRIDRLVSLGKIDAAFIQRLEKIEVTPLAAAPVAYKAKVSQTMPADGSQPFQVELFFDIQGKPLTFQLVPGGAAGPDLQWTEKDAGSLTENSLHYILDSVADAKVRRFFDGLTSVTLSKGELSDAVVARGQFRSSLGSEILNVYLKLDGSFISAEILP